MDKRLQQFLTAENITQSQFADRIGVAKASVSHILAGRNKPGFEFVESMARCYPSLNLEWLIVGKGKMYKGMDPQSAERPESAADETRETGLSDSHELELFPDSKESIDSQQQTASVSPAAQKPEPPRIKKILVFYDNGTFKEIE